jgi:predicted peptidase
MALGGGNTTRRPVPSIKRYTFKEIALTEQSPCLSSGGAGVWSLAAHNPNRWAAIVPVSSSGCAPASAPRIKEIPCWCFHNVNDVGSPPDDPRAMIAALRRAGGTPRYTESFYPATTAAERHNAWDAAYGNPELYDWLLTRQSR